MKLPLIAFALVAVISCGKSGDEAAAKDESAGAVVGASIATVATQPFVETVDAVGTVTVRPGHAASLSAPGPARVANTPVSQGAQVSAGQTLIELERAPFDAAVKSADAALDAAQKAADRAQRLADAGVGTRKDAEAAAAELAKARLDAANARRALDLATMRSPIAGVVTRMTAMLGANVDAGQVLVEVADPHALDVALTVSIADAARVHAGQTVLFRAGEGTTDAVATGRVADISATIDTASRGVFVRVELATGVGAVRIGETVFGRVAVAEHENAVVVPLEALVPDGEGFKVFVVDDKGVALSRTVTLGGRSDKGAWVQTGLKAGEHIVTRGAYGVSDSAKVETGKQQTANGERQTANPELKASKEPPAKGAKKQ